MGHPITLAVNRWYMVYRFWVGGISRTVRYCLRAVIVDSRSLVQYVEVLLVETRRHQAELESITSIRLQLRRRGGNERFVRLVWMEVIANLMHIF